MSVSKNNLNSQTDNHNIINLIKLTTPIGNEYYQDVLFAVPLINPAYLKEVV